MKRSFDIFFAAIGIIVTLPAFIIIAIAILRHHGTPIFYVTERMKTNDQPFNLIKFRTMSNTPDDENLGATGGNKFGRITSIGHKLRRYHLDELPQFINILRGEMSFVGPRPPLRRYTDAFPDLYDTVLQSKPGVTGLATLYYHRHEERLIANTLTAAETEEIYTTRCIPRKAALDLIYQRHRSIRFDAAIILQTVFSVLKR